jgi:hypothetical protein
MGYGAVQFRRRISTFWRRVLSPSSGKSDYTGGLEVRATSSVREIDG